MYRNYVQAALKGHAKVIHNSIVNYSLHMNSLSTYLLIKTLLGRILFNKCFTIISI